MRKLPKLEWGAGKYPGADVVEGYFFTIVGDEDDIEWYHYLSETGEQARGKGKTLDDVKKACQEYYHGWLQDLQRQIDKFYEEVK